LFFVLDYPVTPPASKRRHRGVNNFGGRRRRHGGGKAAGGALRFALARRGCLAPACLLRQHPQGRLWHSAGTCGLWREEAAWAGINILSLAQFPFPLFYLPQIDPILFIVQTCGFAGAPGVVRYAFNARYSLGPVLYTHTPLPLFVRRAACGGGGCWVGPTMSPTTFWVLVAPSTGWSLCPRPLTAAFFYSLTYERWSCSVPHGLRSTIHPI